VSRGRVSRGPRVARSREPWSRGHVSRGVARSREPWAPSVATRDDVSREPRRRAASRCVRRWRVVATGDRRETPVREQRGAVPPSTHHQVLGSARRSRGRGRMNLAMLSARSTLWVPLPTGTAPACARRCQHRVNATHVSACRATVLQRGPVHVVHTLWCKRRVGGRSRAVRAHA
jgi:hypothetical protein